MAIYLSCKTSSALNHSLHILPRILCPLLISITVALLATPAAVALSLTGQASVIDGDTIEIHGQRIRLHGIDAPESSQLCKRPSGDTWRCGQQAALALSDQIGQGPVACRQVDTDHYGRSISICTSSDQDLNEWMVREGWAVAYRRYSEDYVVNEQQAKDAAMNIWSSDFVMPWDWRRGDRIEDRQQETQHASGCAIKGNISRDGTRIYHVPGGAFYDRTRISPEQGERWFCSEAEAKAAGWRRSMR